jgi:hypothetical protein
LQRIQPARCSRFTRASPRRSTSRTLHRLAAAPERRLPRARQQVRVSKYFVHNRISQRLSAGRRAGRGGEPPGECEPRASQLPGPSRQDLPLIDSSDAFWVSATQNA